MQPPLTDIFVLLSRTFPDSVSLTRIVLGKQNNRQAVSRVKLKLEGIAAGEDYEVFNRLSRIAEDLEKSPFFQNVVLDSSEKAYDSGQAVTRFTLNCPLDPACFI